MRSTGQRMQVESNDRGEKYFYFHTELVWIREDTTQQAFEFAGDKHFHEHWNGGQNNIKHRAKVSIAIIMAMREAGHASPRTFRPDDHTLYVGIPDHVPTRHRAEYWRLLGKAAQITRDHFGLSQLNWPSIEYKGVEVAGP